MFWRKEKPLLQCEVLHELPGRVRIACRAIRHLGEYVRKIETRLGDLAPVISAQVNPVTSNVLVHYDSEQATTAEMVDLAESVIGAYSLTA
jgi:cation-transporting P-type ATPase C